MPRPRQRGDSARQASEAIWFLLQGPTRTVDLATALGCSRRTAERVLRGIEASGRWSVTVERRGAEAWYRVTTR